MILIIRIPKQSESESIHPSIHYFLRPVLAEIYPVHLYLHLALGTLVHKFEEKKGL